MSQFAIITIGYNRTESLQRLWNSLEVVEYCGDQIDLIISIDKSNNDNVSRIAHSYEWNFGKKIVREFPRKMGLRDHILSCGEYLKDYEAIAVFEDDIIVSPSFYIYMKESVNYYGDNQDIAGISLYSHQWNSNVNLPFQPVITEYDTYFMQSAQSWGQIWMRSQWICFEDWYRRNKDIYKNDLSQIVPQNVIAWPETSWLKYHICYCIMEKKYFVYPYNSLTTNFTAPGTHYKVSITRYQVPFVDGVKSNYVFSPYTAESLKYDSFYENIKLKKELDIIYPQITIDLHGGKPEADGSRYLLTTNVLNFKIVKKYALQLRPIELNIFYNIAGNDIFLYDKKTVVKNSSSKLGHLYKIYDYYIKERRPQGMEWIGLIVSRLRNIYKYIFNN